MVNQSAAGQVADDGVQAMNTFYERAFSLLDSPEAREAFNIAAEPKSCATTTAGTRPVSVC